MDFYKMLDDVYDELGVQETQKIIIPDPEIETGTTKVIWKNVKEFLKMIITETKQEEKPLILKNQTTPRRDHFIDFIKYKLKIDVGWVSSHTSDGLILHNKKIKAKDLADIMKNYLENFSVCMICKKPNTEMYKDKDLRKWKIKCSDCNSDYTII